MQNWLSVSPRSLGENLAALASAQLLTWGLTGITLTLLPRYLGPSDFGRVTLAMTYGAFALTFCGLGLPTLVTKYVARDGTSARDQVFSALMVVLVLGLTVALGVSAAVPFFGYDQQTEILIWIAMGFVPLFLLLSIAYGVLQGFEVMRLQAFVDVLGKVGTLATVLLLIAFGLGAITYSLVTTVIAAVTSVPLFVVAYRAIKLRGARTGHVRRVVREGLPLYSTEVFLAFYVMADLFLLSLLADERSVGLYAAPLRIFSTLLFLPNVVAIVLFPRLSMAFATDRSYFRTLCYWAISSVFVAGVPMCIGGAVLSNEVAAAIFGGSYADSGVVSMVLAFSVLPTSLNVLTARIFIASDEQLKWSGVMCVALVSKVALNLLLIPLFESRFDNAALGAALGLLTVEITMSLLGLMFMPRIVRNDLLNRTGAKAVVCAVIALAVLAAGASFSLLAAGAVAMAVYVLLGLQLRIIPHSRERLFEPVRLLRTARAAGDAS